MPRQSPFVIDLSNEERQRLESLVRRRTAEQRMVLRARIVLAAARGEQNASIAERLGVALNTVIKWQAVRADALGDAARRARRLTMRSAA